MKALKYFILITTVGLCQSVLCQTLTPKDGTYQISAENKVLMVDVFDGEVKRVYNKSSKKKQLDIVIKFFEYTDDGFKQSSDYLHNIFESPCVQNASCVSTTDDTVQYWVVMSSDCKNCWYKCDDTEWKDLYDLLNE
ncbi:MAG: hypothetical protein J6P44_05180 [Bacteroidales bacterium]|nr:hypothetical protein [Bacteroidales bacterium]